MSVPDVGYGRPPKGTRWKKGQSGNPGAKKRRPAAVATVEIIDRLFVKANSEAGTIKTSKAHKVVLHPHLVGLGFPTFVEAVVHPIKEHAASVGLGR